MARLSNVNNTFTTLGGFMFAVEGVLLAAGWTVVASSDGTTYNASGDQISGAGTGAGGRDNNASWRTLQDPAGRRQLNVQKGTSMAGGTHFRVKFSELDKFVIGSPSATQVPQAADEQVLLGSGTDASPTYGTLFVNSGTARLHMVAESTAVGGVYGFSMFCTNTGAATQASGVFFCEPMAPGSYRPADVSPCLWHCATTFTGTCSGWFAYNLAGEAWSTSIAANAGPYNGALGVSLVDSADDNGYPTYLATVSAAVRIKGVGSSIAIKGPARTYPATANTATDAKAYLGSYCWPYPLNTVPSVS